MRFHAPPFRGSAWKRSVSGGSSAAVLSIGVPLRPHHGVRAPTPPPGQTGTAPRQGAITRSADMIARVAGERLSV